MEARGWPGASIRVTGRINSRLETMPRFFEVLVRIAFEERIRREIGLRDERLVARGADQVVNMLGRAVVIMAREESSRQRISRRARLPDECGTDIP